MPLYERDQELARVGDVLTAARAGRGAVLLVEGVPGIGKTALLRAAVAAAGDRGVRALTAVGGELEQELPFAIVRQLFEPVLRSADPEPFSGAAALAAPVFGAGGGSESATGSVVHGLYWLCSNLAERGPLMLTVDDAHWADEASLRFISHLARRIADLPVLLLLCGRPRMPGSGLTRALSGTHPEVLVLSPLSDRAVAGLVRERMSGAADDVFCQACSRATGGNPFLLAEALTSLRADRVRPVAAEAGRVEDLRPETVSRAVLSRLARVGPEAVRLARALAVLGPVTDLHRAARLAGVQRPRAAEIADALAQESIITGTRPVEFVHPLVRTAVYADGSDMRRAADHKRAALILAADDAPPETLVPHLLAAEPESDPFVVGALRTAAAGALARGAPETAAACLTRALAEPPAPAERPRLHADLGYALGMAHRPEEAAEALRAAFDLTEDPLARGRLALDLGTIMVLAGRVDEARETFERARRAIGDTGSELSLRLHAAFALAAFASREPPGTWMGRLDRLAAGLSGATDAERLILGCLAFGASVTGDRPAAEVADLASRAASGPLPARHGWVLANFTNAALGIAGRHSESLAVLDRAIENARRRGDVAEFRYLLVLRSHTGLYSGSLLDAEADGRAALALHEEDQAREIPLAAAVLVDALAERGAVTEAQAVLAERGLEDEDQVRLLIGHFVHLARGRLRLRQNRFREAARDLRACGDALSGAGYTNPNFAEWRSNAALAHLALGERAAAMDLAAEDLELARRFGAPRAIAIALRATGLIEAGARGLALLEEAVAVAELSSADLVRARALVDYGSALRRAGRRADAQPPLRRGLDLAARIGARPLATQATEELTATGARPRRELLTGPLSLTAAELRVARLAAEEATNREIAQMLFVSRRTVEIHLTSTYRKLGIDSRRGLKAALAALSTA
ncbi:AAA family ATPase [Actinoallomurus vinaceus]|uniref:AAA family ATPase n=1 Tax=Actinoallomurus vinaceus TaxID=1080074 RepID=A0ABP8UKP0_9ACTN